jgi:hypothetical protein
MQLHSYNFFHSKRLMALLNPKPLVSVIGFGFTVGKVFRSFNHFKANSIDRLKNAMNWSYQEILFNFVDHKPQNRDFRGKTHRATVQAFGWSNYCKFNTSNRLECAMDWSYQGFSFEFAVREPEPQNPRTEKFGRRNGRANLKRSCSAGGAMSLKFQATARREAATDACTSDRNMEEFVSSASPSYNDLLRCPPLADKPRLCRKQLRNNLRCFTNTVARLLSLRSIEIVLGIAGLHRHSTVDVVVTKLRRRWTKPVSNFVDD